MYKYLFIFFILFANICPAILCAQDNSSGTSNTQNSIPYYESLGASPRVARLMTQMKLIEKIGQLNLITPGGIVTGEIVSKDVESKIKAGKVGGI